MSFPSAQSSFRLKFQLLSDLHLESPTSLYETYTFAATAPNLVMAGDIGNVRDAGFFVFLANQLRRFERVFLVLGNHEPYHSSFPEAVAAVTNFEREHKAAREKELNGKLPTSPTSENKPSSGAPDPATTAATAALGEFVFLNRTRYDIPGAPITVLGCTLFTNVPETAHEDISIGLNDFHQIASWTVADHNSAHAGDLEWLNYSVAQTRKDRRVLVVTHHSPTERREANNPIYEGSKYNSGFSTELRWEVAWRGLQGRGSGRVLGAKVGEKEAGGIWAFGHTHYNVDVWLDGIRVIANQRGYAFRPSAGFEAERVYEI